MAVNNYVSVPELTIKSDVLSTDANFKLQNIQWYVGSDGVAVNLAVADFGSSGVGYGVWDERTSSQEFFTWDTTTLLNATTTGITILSRGLPWGSDYTTEATSRKFFHASGSRCLLFTNAPAFYNTFLNKANAETVTGVITLTSTAKAKYNTHPTFTADEEIIDKKYADDLALAGAPDASTTVKGNVEIATGAELAAGTGTGGTGAVIVPAGSSFKNSSAGAGDATKVPVLNASGVLDQTFLDSARTWGAVQSFTANNCQITSDADTANDAVRYSFAQAMTSLNAGTGTSGEAYSAGQALYLKASDGKLYKAVGTADESTYSFVGIALDAAGAGDVAGLRFTKPGGIATGLSGLTAGSYYFISDTAGTIAVTPGTRFAKVGQALTTTTLRVCEPKFVRSGSASMTSVTTFVQTCGFYPMKIVIRTSQTIGQTGQYSWSVGDDTNSCVFVENAVGSGYSATEAWHNGANNAGTIISKTQTGFTLNCTVRSGTNDAIVNWTAFSE